MTQPLDRGHPADTQGLFEVVVLPHGGNGLIIAFAQAQQAKIAAKDIDLGNVIAPLGHLADIPAQVAVPVDAGAGQGQPGVAGVEFFAALFEDQSFHVFTCRVSFRDRRILHFLCINFNILSGKMTSFY